MRNQERLASMLAMSIGETPLPDIAAVKCVDAAFLEAAFTKHSNFIRMEEKTGSQGVAFVARDREGMESSASSRSDVEDKAVMAQMGIKQQLEVRFTNLIVAKLKICSEDLISSPSWRFP